jgi:hypothetical protein
MTQLEYLKKYFPKHHRLTSKEAALLHGICSLSRRICDLTELGWEFKKIHKEVPTRYTKARIVEYVFVSAPKKRGA